MSSTNTNNSYAGVNNDKQGGLLEALLALKLNINRDLNVATLAEVVEVDTSNNVATVRPFPLLDNENEKSIDVIGSLYYDGKDYHSITSLLELKDVVLVVFLNRNTNTALRQTKNKQKRTTLTSNTDLHSDKFGVITNIIYKANIKEV